MNMCVCVCDKIHTFKAVWLFKIWLSVYYFLFQISIPLSDLPSPYSTSGGAKHARALGGHTLTIRGCVLSKPPSKMPTACDLWRSFCEGHTHLPCPSYMECSHHHCSKPGPPCHREHSATPQPGQDTRATTQALKCWAPGLCWVWKL